MRAVIAIAVFLSAVTSVRAANVVLTSPDQARTFAYGEMVWHQLSIDPDTHSLTARITFSNRPYDGSPEGRIDEPFDFRFPGTHLDSTTGTISVRARKGKLIPVARFRGNLVSGSAELTSGAKLYLIKKSGRVTALLTATSEPRPGMRWIQMNDNWSLQNLIAGLCCGR